VNGHGLTVRTRHIEALADSLSLTSKITCLKLGIIKYNNYTMEFEFDPQKSDKNKIKHGIDFNEAQELWDDPDLIEIPVRTSDEPRYL